MGSLGLGDACFGFGWVCLWDVFGSDLGVFGFALGWVALALGLLWVVFGSALGAFGLGCACFWRGWFSLGLSLDLLWVPLGSLWIGLRLQDLGQVACPHCCKPLPIVSLPFVLQKHWDKTFRTDAAP